MYFVSYVKLCMTTSRDESISYDLSQLLKRSAIASSLLSIIYYNSVVL
jgi:hypothetical protein